MMRGPKTSGTSLTCRLADLVTKIKAAAVVRDDAYDGRIGAATDLPDLIN